MHCFIINLFRIFYIFQSTTQQNTYQPTKEGDIMDVIVGLALVKIVLQVLNLSVWSEIYTIIDVKSDLKKLKTTIHH